MREPSRLPDRNARFLLAAACAALFLWIAPVAQAAPGAGKASQAAPGCTFASLAPEQQRRYASRYKRRVRLDGQAHADRWLQEQACPSAAQAEARKKRMVRKWGQTDKQGRPCKNYRTVNRATPSLDGAMTMSRVRVCAD